MGVAEKTVEGIGGFLGAFATKHHFAKLNPAMYIHPSEGMLNSFRVSDFEGKNLTKAMFVDPALAERRGACSDFFVRQNYCDANKRKSKTILIGVYQEGPIFKGVKL